MDQMPFEMEKWVRQLTKKLQQKFGDQLLFVGLQGSYRRGEATLGSDVDLVVVLEKLSVEGLQAYRNVLDTIPYREKACGFICGRRELWNWPSFDLFQLCVDTKPILGSLDTLAPEIDVRDALDAVRIGAANLYHAACHSYLYGKDRTEGWRSLCKSTFFLLRAKCYADRQEYPVTKRELGSRLKGEDKEIFDAAMGQQPDMDVAYERLIRWTASCMRCTDQ